MEKRNGVYVMETVIGGDLCVSMSRDDEGRAEDIAFLIGELDFDESGTPVETEHLAVISADEARLMCVALNRLIQEIEEAKAVRTVDNL
jgi:hypothetical protein